MDNFMKRVSAAQAELKAPKNQMNKFGGYKYRSCEDILEAAKPVLAKNGIVLTVSDSIIQVGTRYYIQATAILHDTESEATLENSAFAREAETKKGMDDSQVTGTASSYARKYALNGLLCIDDTKDADTDEYGKQTKGEDNDKSKNPPAIPPIPMCSCCGKQIIPIKNGGKLYSPREIAANTMETFGQELCWRCASERRSEGA